MRVDALALTACAAAFVLVCASCSPEDEPAANDGSGGTAGSGGREAGRRHGGFVENRPVARAEPRPAVWAALRPAA